MQNNRKGYYDFDVDFEAIMLEAGMVDEMFRLQDLKSRKLFLNENISQDSVHEVVKHILQYNSDDKGIAVDERKPILLYVVSNGGSVAAGYELIDAIMNSKTPVYTINLGYQYSMGFLIGLAGHKRFATQNATFLMHDGSNFVYDSGAKVQDRVKFDMRLDERTKAYILSRGNLTSEEYDSKFRVEWYMFADEAKERGFVDYIIGVDCDMDEVI
jgi:ATP-dependent Clp protease protease subunit